MDTGDTQVQMMSSGAARVQVGGAETVWTPLKVEKAVGAAISCCTGRGAQFPAGTGECQCTACTVAGAFMRWDHRRKGALEP